MDKERIVSFYNSHRWGINGAGIGFVIAAAIIIVGFFKILFIAICSALGYYIGKRLSDDKEYIKNLLDRVLPPGMNR
jgi:uncharacterized membrane protein